MSEETHSSRFSPEAEWAFARHLADAEAGRGPGFEALCAERPELAEELRGLKAQWEQVAGVVQHLLQGPAGIGSKAVASQWIEAGGGTEAPAAPDLVQQLAEHSPSSSRYELRGEFARGGMGVILKAWDKDLRRDLAMKVILGKGDAASKGSTPPVDELTLGRFLEEAQVTGQLDHPGVVPVYELGLDARGRVYFTMRLVKGLDLGEVLVLMREGKEGWTRTRVLGVLLKVCEAMAYAHSKGVVHRDLKPSNVMVGRFGEVYVMDWGLARVIGRKDTHDLRIRATTTKSLHTTRRDHAAETPDSPIVTMDGTVVGTPSYMPPEQAEGRVEELGPSADVYALGAILYELLTGQKPYVRAGSHPSPHTILAALLQGPPTPIEELTRDAPAEVVAITEKAMAREPGQRYRDMLDLARDLRAYLEGRVVQAYEAGAWAEARKWVQRNKPLAASLAAAVLLLVVGLTASLMLRARAEGNAVLATQNATRLRVAWRFAEQNAVRAHEKAAEADRLRQEAVVREEAANARADALWAIEELKYFNTLDDDLEYACSQDRPAYVWWLERAHELVDGHPADPTRGLRRKPGLADHRRLLAEIRQAARTPTEAELAADRASHPKAKELETKRAELLWTSRMLGLEPWPSEAEVEAALERQRLPSDANVLNNMAWELVDPNAPVRGQELRALALARGAVACTRDDKRAMYRYTLAWALLWAGKPDEALAEERQALEEIGSELRGMIEAYSARVESLARPYRDGTARAQHQVLAAEVAKLEREVDALWTYRYDDREKEWGNTHLGRLEQDLEDLARRIALADRSVESPQASQAWKDAIEAIAASPNYGGLRISPQLELLPLGPDRESGLWEFAHLATGEPAVRWSDGRLAPTPETGIVFVLLPSGRVPVEDGKTPTPLNEVQLDPFFLSKYEMTVAQWTSTSPGTLFWKDEPLFPVNRSSWIDCVETLERAGLFLRLPTEAQWEYGCRARTTTPWWTGAEEDSLLSAANIQPIGIPGELQEIGCLLANPFGLHDVHGNVAEWCCDKTDGVAVRPGDGKWEAAGSRGCVIRGGGVTSGVRSVSILGYSGVNGEAAIARSGYRSSYLADIPIVGVGLRPARALTP